MLIQIKTYNKQCGAIANVTCPKCNRMTMFNKMRNKTMGSVMFIPVISKTNITYLQCTACNAAFQVNKKAFKNITNASQAVEAMVTTHQGKVAKQEEARERYSVGFSEKNQTLAVILAALFFDFGVPFFYIGKPILGIACLLASVLSCAVGLFPILFLMTYGGLVLAVFIGMGKIKDGNGKYILSEKQKQLYK